jgi:hypothetical protein
LTNASNRTKIKTGTNLQPSTLSISTIFSTFFIIQLGIEIKSKWDPWKMGKSPSFNSEKIIKIESALAFTIAISLFLIIASMEIKYTYVQNKSQL